MISERKKPERKIIGSAVVKQGPLNVRKQPSATAPILKQVAVGEKFNVTEGGNAEFTAVIVDDVIAYTMTKYLQVTMN